MSGAAPSRRLSTRLSFILLALAATIAFTAGLGSYPLLGDPNEGQYAEVAREMVESGEWLSPQLDYVLFLNKPPLTYWLIAASYQVAGIGEFAARLPSAIAAIAIVLCTAWLGFVLFDRRTGLLAGWMLVATAGLFVEAHLVRPDLQLTLGVTAALVALAYLLRDAGRPRTAVLLALQAALAFGLLAKGMVALLIPGGVGLVLIVSQRRWALLRELLRPRAWWLLVVLVVPWHVVMSLRHDGFAWDYIVNQHLLFFFDKKEPRDSIPIALWQFWAAFAGRMFPWTLFLPLLVVTRRQPGWAENLLWLWVLVVLGLFSAATARLEHYSIPAIPAVVLLLARVFAVSPPCVRPWSAVVLVVMTSAALCGVYALRSIPAEIDAALAGIARSVALVLAGGFAVAFLLVLRRHGPVVAVVATFLALVPLFLQGLGGYAQLTSIRRPAQAIEGLGPEVQLVYLAPIEYQNVAPWLFYLQRKIAILRPPDFVAPEYLRPHEHDLFIDRDTLARWWANRNVVLIKDTFSEDRIEAAAPGPFETLWRNDQSTVVRPVR